MGYYYYVIERQKKSKGVKMSRIRKFGIYKDTTRKGWYWAVAEDGYGAHYSWAFSGDDLENGWNRPSGIGEPEWNARLGKPKKKRGSSVLKTEGFFQEVFEKRGRRVPDEMMEGFRNFSVTPTFVRNCGRVACGYGKALNRGAGDKPPLPVRATKYRKTGAHRIKWAEPKKGNWGGRREKKI